MGWNLGSNPPVVAIDIPGCSGICAGDDEPNCPLGESGNWIAYPGGVWTIDSACIEIATDGETTLVELPIGLECPQS